MIRPTIACALALLGGCTTGTAARFSGTLCGQAVEFELTDQKDRSQFEARVDCGGGQGVTISTADSSVSAVIRAQAEALTALAGQLAREAAAGALP